jgi:hypothetical protein
MKYTVCGIRSENENIWEALSNKEKKMCLAVSSKKRQREKGKETNIDRR